MRFDVLMLTNILTFIYKDSTLRTRKTLTNIYKLFNFIDMSIYEDNETVKNLYETNSSKKFKF